MRLPVYLLLLKATMKTPVPSAPSPTAGSRPLPCSVIIPTYNPRPVVLAAVIEALRAQTLPPADWELIVVDNNSRPAVAAMLDLSWHPNARLVLEKQPGNQHARALGLRESTGELIINVDDDNVLAPDYLEQALAIAREWPNLGVWGGRIHPEFESTPPEWLQAHSHHLAICHFDQPVWSSFVDDRSMPYGAGMCIRRRVAEVHLAGLDEGGLKCLGRHDGSFVSGEDQVIVYAATSIGLAAGRFPQLEMRHRISSRRFDPGYLSKLVRGNAHGALLVQMLHGNAQSRRTRWAWPVLKIISGLLFQRGMSRRLMIAEARGELDAQRDARGLAKRSARGKDPTTAAAPLKATGAAPVPGR